MFSSIFSSGDPKAPNFHPVTSETPPQELYGPLTPADLQWTCAGGFATETQIFYSFNKDGTFIMLQVIHASVGVWFPTIQFVVNVYNPATKERIFSSTNVSNFSTAAGANDKISSKADEFSIIHNGKPTEPGVAESYTITARPSTELQVSVVVSRTADAAGWRLGRGPHGGRSWFGKTPTPDSADGYVVHRFWPRTTAKGHIVYKGKALDVDGPGMLVHAIQGMRPNLVASRWNFCHFQSEEAGGVSAIQMEFTTVNAYGAHGSGSGHVRVNIGSIVVGGKLVAVTGETRYPEGNAPAQQTAADKAKGDAVVSRAEHVTTARDADNGYMAPTKLAFTWRGPHIAQPSDTVEAHLEVDIGSPDNMNGLIEKVDILHQVPGAIKTIISAAAGLKPIIYQWLNPAELVITGKNLVPDQTSDKITVKGWVNNEATFISE